ncbi:MAG: hypothetical protein H6739_21895 [Alphaproteobacteria bacterium]|nr:hypothetical protein [Alphaproteobacteria bacterium]
MNTLGVLTALVVGPAQAAPEIHLQADQLAFGPRGEASLRWGDDDWRVGPALAVRTLGYDIGRATAQPMWNFMSGGEVPTAILPTLGVAFSGEVAERWSLTAGVASNPLTIVDGIRYGRLWGRSGAGLAIFSTLYAIAGAVVCTEFSMGVSRSFLDGQAAVWAGIRPTLAPLTLDERPESPLFWVNPGVGFRASLDWLERDRRPWRGEVDDIDRLDD